MKASVELAVGVTREGGMVVVSSRGACRVEILRTVKTET